MFLNIISGKLTHIITTPNPTDTYTYKHTHIHTDTHLVSVPFRLYGQFPKRALAPDNIGTCQNWHLSTLPQTSSLVSPHTIFKGSINAHILTHRNSKNKIKDTLLFKHYHLPWCVSLKKQKRMQLTGQSTQSNVTTRHRRHHSMTVRQHGLAHGIPGLRLPLSDRGWQQGSHTHTCTMNHGPT